MSDENISSPRWEKLKYRFVALVPILAPGVLVVFAVLHSVLPRHVALDWPTVTLLIVGIVFMFLPVRDLAAKLLKLKVGNFELELKQATQDLTQKTAEAEAEVNAVVNAVGTHEEPTVASAVIPEVKANAAVSASRSQENTPPTSGEEKRPRHYDIEFDELTLLRYETDQLTAIDPKAGLIRVAATLEQRVINIATLFAPASQLKVRSFSIALSILLREGVIRAALAEALAKFWSIRSKVTHQSETVDDASVRNAIDDGLKLILLLDDAAGIAGLNRE